MITVKKGSLQTQIESQFADRYLANGWVEVKTPKPAPKTEEEKLIADSLDPKQAADNRQENPVNDPVAQAAAIASTEMRKRKAKKFDDGLLIDETKAAETNEPAAETK